MINGTVFSFFTFFFLCSVGIFLVRQFQQNPKLQFMISAKLFCIPCNWHYKHSERRYTYSSVFVSNVNHWPIAAIRTVNVGHIRIARDCQNRHVNSHHQTIVNVNTCVLLFETIFFRRENSSLHLNWTRKAQKIARKWVRRRSFWRRSQNRRKNGR